eukprot:s199_g15.t1
MAMSAKLRIRQREPWWHGCSMLRQLREFWISGDLCDVVIKSLDGREHNAHRNVLSAASTPLSALLNGSFSEGNQILAGQPVEIAASGEVVAALIDHIYGGEPRITTTDAMELLRLSGAYGLMELVSEIERELQASLDSTTALEVLQQIDTLGLTLTDLRKSCEEEIASNFENCMSRDSFNLLGAAQLARILSKPNLWVPREEVVIDGLFKWVHASNNERSSKLSMLLQHIDFPSLSMKNLEKLSMYAQSLGQNGFELQYSVDEAKQLRGKGWQWHREHVPKRHCLQFWSPELGAFPHGYRAGRWVAGEMSEPIQPSSEEEDEIDPRDAVNFCWHQDNIYIADGRRLTRWKPGGQAMVLVRDHLMDTSVAVAPCGQIFLADAPNERLLTLEDGQLTEVLRLGGLRSVCVTSAGTIYLLGCASHNIGWVVRLDGDKTVPVINSRDLLQKFHCNSAFVRMFAQGEVLYILGWHMEDDAPIDFVLKVPPDGSEPVLVGRGYESSTDLRSLFVTDTGKIYCADAGSVAQVLTFNPGDRHGLKVFDNAQRFWYDKPVDVLARDLDTTSAALYVLYQSGLVYCYQLPPELVLPEVKTHSTLA